MTSKPLPKGYKLHPDVDPMCLTDEYAHWTVADVIEMLSDYPQDARVWFLDEDSDDALVRPVEFMAGGEGEVFL